MNTTDFILSVAVPSIFWEGLDYLPPVGVAKDRLQLGQRLLVPLGSRQVVGILLAIKSASQLDPHKLKCVLQVLDEQPLLSSQLLALYGWVSDYYHYPIGEVIMGTLPTALRKAKPAVLKKKPNEFGVHFETKLELTPEQQHAVSVIQSSCGYQTFLLDGVTGSGKTEVYMRVIAKRLQSGQQVLVLVPEIALTPQTLARFRDRFNVPIVALHSALADGARLQHWLLCREDIPLIVIGTRSSVFAPFSALGLIVIDEEHDLSFKQHTGLRYSARDVAIKRARDLNIPVVLGSATPSLESLHNAEHGRSTHLKLTTRVSGGAMPLIQVIDLRGQNLQAGLSPLLLKTLAQHLAAGNQVLLFLNRRGFAPVMFCHHCGWVVRCHRCEANLVWHQHRQRLVCHHCDAAREPPESCSQCQQANLIPVGVGTEQLEAALAERFPEVPVIRIDRDSTRRKNSLEAKLEQLATGEPAIMVGTQMLTKGHHFPKLSLVAIVEVDSGLMGVDFRAHERLAQLVVQVSGRAGRGDRRGQVLVQTHQPHHPFLQCLLNQGYQGMVAPTLLQRQQFAYPPYGFLAMLHADATCQDWPEQFLTNVRQWLVATGTEVSILGPVPAPLERLRGRYRAQLLLKSSSRRTLNIVLKQLVRSMGEVGLARKVRWALDVDPQTLQ